MEKRGDGADAELQLDADFVPDPAQICTGNEKDDKAFSVPHSRRPNLSSLQIPAWSLDIALSTFAKTDGPSVSRSSPGSTRGLPPRPNSAKVRSSMRSLLPQRSIKTNTCSQDTERTGLIVPNTPPSDAPLDKPSTSTHLSLNNKVISPSTKVAHSLPVTPFATSAAENVPGRHLGGDSGLSTMEVHQHMTRSFSVPVNGKATTNLRVADSRGLIRVISAKLHLETVGGTSTDGALVTDIAIEDATEDIPEEQAVCRICLVELGEGGNTLKMECSCKGDLALAHQDCAVKWFSIKGNRTCDVCKQDVQNLPVTLLKIYNPQTTARQASNVPQQTEVAYYRIWQDVPVLIVVSMLAYFCFLEQLLVSDLGPRALAISLPFSCVLGLLSSMIASTMVSRSFVWAYACFQFAILILFAHVFYTILNVNAILSVLLSSFTGFGIAISMNSLVVEFIRWRTSRRIQSSFENVDRIEQQRRGHVQQQRQEDQGQQQRQRQHQ
ncbi:E3 ubiquitin ligase SUD1 [Spatholobus suberectus]|nr:E3 ubiquitin ligase SUD1 [Spatholobus suberectus]